MNRYRSLKFDFAVITYNLPANQVIQTMSMLKYAILTTLIALMAACTPNRPADTLTPQPFNHVVLEDSFWKPRLQTQYDTLVPFALDKTQPAVENLRRTANYLNGVEDELPEPERYIISDLFKVMEGVSYLLMEHDDPELERQMDEIIEIISEAQQEDGYLYPAHITGVADKQRYDPWGGGGMGDRPYSWVVHSHELYDMGHMYEAAVAYYQATGKDRWLNVAEKNAQHINRVFFEGDPNYNDGEPVNQAPGHQEIELALTKLYRVTGNELYLEMAKKFLDIRGVTYKPEGERYMSPTYAQQHAPVTEQEEAVGHAVRAAYMYAGMAAVDALTGGNHYGEALDRIWHNIVDTKMAITGGLGATRGIEGFGPSYVLPNEDTYNETCAAVGNVFFNYRMFLNSRDARYFDVAEIALLNNALAGVNLEGNRFFYVNPLEADGESPFNFGEPGRKPWFTTACCPTNIARLIPQVPGLIYSYTPGEIYVTFYGSNFTSIPLEGGDVKISQKSGYPFEGTVELTLEPTENQEFGLKLRIPTWARSDRFVPGELYRYENDIERNWSVEVNGEPAEAALEKGFAVIRRTWQPGDRVELTLPMETRFNTAIDSVEADRNKAAVTRGPLVFAAEEIDNGVEAQQLHLAGIPGASQVRADRFEEGKLENILRLHIPAQGVEGAAGAEGTMTLIPYYAWNNRGNGSMRVWFPLAGEQ